MDDLSTRRYVLFDFDGTLADTKRAIIDTATTVLLGMGLSRADLADIDLIIGPPFPEAFEQVFGLSRADAEEVTRRYREIYATLGPEAWPLFDGIRKLVADLRAEGKVVCVATSKRQHVLERALADEGMQDAFDLTVGKPSDEPFTKAQTIAHVLDLLGAKADEAVMVGDRHHDVDGANEVGVPCVGVTYGGTGDYAELDGAGAACVVDTVAQLAEVLLGSAHAQARGWVQQ